MRGFSQGFDGFQSGDEAPLPEPRIAIVLWLTLSPICRTAVTSTSVVKERKSPVPQAFLLIGDSRADFAGD